MQRYELDAWLGDDHGLGDDGIRALLAVANDIEHRYPDPDDDDDREAALTVAFRLMVEPPEDVIGELANELARARITEARVLAAGRQAALSLVRDRGRGIESQQGFAERLGVDRSAVREWLGVRRRP